MKKEEIGRIENIIQDQQSRTKKALPARSAYKKTKGDGLGPTTMKGNRPTEYSETVMETFRKSCIYPGDFDAKYVNGTLVLQERVGKLFGFFTATGGGVGSEYMVIMNYPVLASIYSDRAGMRVTNHAAGALIDIPAFFTNSLTWG